LVEVNTSACIANLNEKSTLKYPHARLLQNNSSKWFGYPYIIVVPMFQSSYVLHSSYIVAKVS
jgi:hypothetical protein